MKIIKKITYILSVFTFVLFVIYIFVDNKSYQYNKESSDMMKENFYDDPYISIEEAYQSICSKVIPYIVSANVIIDGKEYEGNVLEDKGNGTTYCVEIDDKIHWVDKYYVTILDVEEFNVEPLTDMEIEIYVNYSKFDSITDYFIWVDLYRNETYILKRKDNFFYLFTRLNCSTGANITPTKRGLFTITKKGDYFYSRDNSYICYNFMQYSGSYLLHSFPYSLKGKVLDDRLNQRVSNGCVRYSKEDSKFIYDLIPIDTSIWIN